MSDFVRTKIGPVHDLLRYQQEAHRELFGGKRLKPSLMRMELVRAVVMAFAKGNILTVSDYQERLVDYGSGGKCRAELALLEDHGLVVCQKSARDRRAVCVFPTRTLIASYNRLLPVAVEYFRSTLGAEADQSSG